ncbi:MAG: ribonuclease HII [Flavobacteriales bacterium]|nr:ribonuclease HII [Flavobacteriales bacterium]|tara:strand:- start:12905 stop:13501 length:597 start_codon:yes stop_codon:yes gene_type:complete
MPQHYKSELKLAGCDEAGRGCLAGPVVAAAVILPKNFKNRMLNDSKVISAKKREMLRTVIEKEAISFGIGIVDSKKIDEINILNASFLAMHKAINTLNTKTELLIIDGNRFNRYKNIPHKCIIKGDGKYLSIAAASILAKTYRDNIMKNIDLEFPQYNWRKNKGYPTKEHRQAISKYGTTIYHRESFKLLPNQLILNI